VITAEVVAVHSDQSAGSTNCEVRLIGSLPPDAVVGKSVEGLIEVGSLPDVVFLARPAQSSANSEAYIFVLEPGGEYARRLAFAMEHYLGRSFKSNAVYRQVTGSSSLICQNGQLQNEFD
jgi:hypothetical protein